MSQNLWKLCYLLTHWGRVMHIYICIGNLTIIGSGNGLLPGQHQAIIETNAGLLSIGPLGTNFSEILIDIIAFSFMETHLKALSVKWQPFSPYALWGEPPVTAKFPTQRANSTEIFSVSQSHHEMWDMVCLLFVFCRKLLFCNDTILY